MREMSLCYVNSKDGKDSRRVRPRRYHGRQVWIEAISHQPGEVKDVFSRDKNTLGPLVRSRTPEAQETETSLACNIFTKMLTVGRVNPVTIAG